MTRGISVKFLNKSFGKFRLHNINVEIPRGYITAIIGNNGAGKTSLLKCITGSYVPDSGVIEFGVPKQYGRIGVVFDECPYPPMMKVDALSRTMNKIFDDWDAIRFENLCKKYGINMSSRVGTLSRGRRMSLQIAVMLSHVTDYLILDEPTSGLDPEAREEFLGLLRDYVSDEEHTVVISSHMTSDLEKIADEIVLMIDGKVMLCQDRVSLLEEYGILKVSCDCAIDDGFIIGTSEGEFGKTALIMNRKAFSESHPEMLIDDASLEDIVVYHMKGRRT